LLIVSLMFSILYWAAPNVRHPGFRWLNPGGVVAVLIWVAASALFALYVSNFSSYNKTYGALAAVIIFLVWLWISNIAVLLGAERKLVFSSGGNPGVGSLHRFRDAIENDWPRPVELEEHSHAGMANRFVAGAAKVPFAVLHGYVGTDLMAHTQVAPITCPFT